MSESPTDKQLLDVFVTNQNKSNHSKGLSCITEMYGNFRRNTTGQVFEQKETLIVQYKHLSQAYDNAQQKILDLETQLKLDSRQLEESKSKLYLYDQLSNLDITRLLDRINQFDINDGEQFLAEWANEQSQLQALSQQLTNENSILKQQSHQFLELNTKLSEDLQETFQDLGLKSDEVVEKETQIEELIEYIDQLKLQSLERDEQNHLLSSDLFTQRENFSQLEQNYVKVTQDQQEQQLQLQKVDRHRLDLQKRLDVRNEEFSQVSIKLQQMQVDEVSLKSECTQLNDQVEALQTNLQRIYGEHSKARSELRYLKDGNFKLESDINQIKQELEQSERSNQNFKSVIEDSHQQSLVNQQGFSELQARLVYEQTNLMDMEHDNQTKFKELQLLYDDAELNCKQYCQELQTYGHIINQYQESMQVVAESLQLDNLESMDDFSMKVEKSIQGMLYQLETSMKDNTKLNDNLEKANSTIKQQKKSIDKLSKDCDNDKQMQYDLKHQIQQQKDKNEQIYRHAEQMTINLDQEHKIKQTKLNCILKTMLDQATSTLGGDFIQLFQELEDVHRSNISHDDKLVEARINALNGELDSLGCLDKKRLNMIQQLEKTNSQLRNDIQILKNEIDLKEYQRRNFEFNSQNIVNQQSYRTTHQSGHKQSQQTNKLLIQKF